MPSVGFEFESDESDEDFESDESDEGFESDESDEGFESDESDEGFESDESDEGSDESDEGSDESDEGSDESDEAVGASFNASFRARQRGRSSAQARAVAADQRQAARRASATQNTIRRSLGAIRGAKPVKVRSTGQLQGSGVVIAELPNGRRTRMRITPALATVRDVNKLAAQVTLNDQRQAKAEAANSRAINKLSSTVSSAVKNLTAQQVKSDAQLAKRIVDGDAKLEKRLNQELNGSKGILAKQRKDLLKALKAERRRATWNSLLIASAMPTFAAYGVKGDPFDPTNLKLTASLAGWLMLDDILAQFGMKGGKGGWLNTATEGWSMLAPIGHAVTARYLFNDAQAERFVTGVAKIDKDKPDAIEIPIALDFQETFKKNTNVPVVATIVSRDAADKELQVQQAKVVEGKLVLILTAVPTSAATIAWVIDTQAIT